MFRKNGQNFTQVKCSRCKAKSDSVCANLAGWRVITYRTMFFRRLKQIIICHICERNSYVDNYRGL